MTEGQDRIIATIADALTPVIQQAIAERSEQVFTVVEELRQEVQQAVEHLRDTAEVLHNNDMAVMAELSRVKGDAPAEMVQQVADSWERFIRAEADALGLKVLVPKGGTGDDG